MYQNEDKEELKQNVKYAKKFYSHKYQDFCYMFLSCVTMHLSISDIWWGLF